MFSPVLSLLAAGLVGAAAVPAMPYGAAWGAWQSCSLPDI